MPNRLTYSVHLEISHKVTDLTEGVQKFHDGIVPRGGGCFDMWGYVFPILGGTVLY